MRTFSSDAHAKIDLDSLDISVAKWEEKSPKRSKTPQKWSPRKRHLLVQGVFTQFTPDARLLESTKWHARVQQVRTIDPGRTRMQRMRKLDPPGDILREYRGGQTVQAVVCLAQHIFFVLKLNDHADWTEDLLLDDAHVWPRVGKDGWLNPVALCAMSLASKVNPGALLLSRIDVTHDTLHVSSVNVMTQKERKVNVKLDLGDLGTLVRIAPERVSELERLGLSSETLEKLIIDARLDKDTRAGTATLPVVKAGRYSNE